MAVIVPELAMVPGPPLTLIASLGAVIKPLALLLTVPPAWSRTPLPVKLPAERIVPVLPTVPGA